jgi:CubicO group peptidase (beta-lactamase class C family)
MMNEGPSTGANGEIRGIELDEVAMRAHVMRPAHLDGAYSDRGPEGVAPLEGRRARADIVYSVDWDAFELELQAALNHSVAGYALFIHQHGGSTEWVWGREPGWAKTLQDGGERWTLGVPMHIASCSKLVTAIAMVKLMTGQALPYNSKIIDFLPQYWTKGPNVDQITFAQLMTHTSGLAFGNTTSASDFQFMKSQIAAGTTHIGEYSYQNMNFGLCRILIATINKNVPVNWEPSEDAKWDYATLTAYQDYVQKNVFAPSGVTGATLTHPSEDALAYNFPVIGSGWNSGDLTTMAGGAGWHMSAGALLGVMDTFRKGQIVTPAQAQTALDEKFGIDWVVTTPVGSFYAKNGLWTDGSHVEQSVAFFLPGSTGLALLVNSPVGSPGQFLLSLVGNLYIKNVKPVNKA